MNATTKDFNLSAQKLSPALTAQKMSDFLRSLPIRPFPAVTEKSTCEGCRAAVMPVTTDKTLLCPACSEKLRAAPPLTERCLTEGCHNRCTLRDLYCAPCRKARKAAGLL